MEKKGLRKKDILRMDGLLPPTRRLPVCDAVSSASDKKKDKKWSIGGILRRISSIRDYDSSSNDEEMVYCNRTPRKLTKLNRQRDGIVLHSIENNSEHDKRITAESNARHSTDSLHSRRDSLRDSRSSDGSLDGLGKKTRRNKLKARAEAKRDHLRADSSSDEDCRRSNSSLNRFQGADGAQNGQRGSVCSRRSRAARTERYIKRLSRDDGNGSGDTLNDLHTKRCSSEYSEDKERAVCSDANGLCRPPIHPRRLGGVYSNSRAFPAQKSSAENLREFADCTGLPEVLNDFRRYSTGQYVTDLNQNNTYGKLSRDTRRDVHADSHQTGHFFTYPAKNVCHYAEPFDFAADRRLIDPYNRPPEPPPRDPRYRVFNYGYGSYPANRHQNVPNSSRPESNKTDVTNGISRFDLRNFRSYGSNDEIAWRDATERELENPTSNSRLRNSLERTNNKYNSSRQWANKAACEETEATRCRRRNTRNDELNSNDADYGMCKVKNKSANICESNKHRKTISSAASPDWSSRSREQRTSRSVTPCDVDNRNDKSKKEDSRRTTPTEEALERRRSSKNLEEALSELEAIYNSLRLGDEDLLDRAERRSMEEFSLKHGKSELDATTVINRDSPDRTKDDMAYRRMHPKERPTSLSDVAGRSTLSNISYLIASPVLSRRDSAEDLARSSSTYPFARRDEPDVTRDDVVFRSISHANNTLRVIEPQPPFGIPLGPVTTATESDYLHTTPTKPEQPRSLYIPQCEPDVVTDDLAYRALRKDTARNVGTESKSDVSKEQSITCGVKKKRAIRSLSANLYGLINQDRIHLRREPSLDVVGDEMQNIAGNFAATSERPEYLRRVVSDGELSDNDRWKEPKAIDINGNHPVDACRKKLRVYVSPEATIRKSPKKEKESNVAEFSDAMLSSKAVLDDEFWHEYLRSDSTASVTNSSRSAETDFTAYSRLCQDLVDLIKSSDDDKTTPPIEARSSGNSIVDAVEPSDKSDSVGVQLRIDEPSSVHVRSLDSRYSGSQCEEENIESENAESTFSTTNSTETSESAPAPGNLDFYLRVADENVKLIAEAFGSVADRLRDSRLSARKKNNSLASHSSEAENQSGSARSSALYSQEEQTSDDRPVVAPRLEESPRQISKHNSWTSNDGDQSGASRFDDVSTADAELDLSRAVRDLQLAAASLCEHGREIEELKIKRGRLPRVHNVTPITASTDTDEGNPVCKIGLIVDTQEQERDQEETVVLPNERIEPRSDARSEEKRREGERTVCELDRTKSCYAEAARFVRVPCVTNLITVMVTTYSMLLLACLLALLLAIVVAS
ncbi:uncharacterized protein [Linepithema humile]|uniref:uncharacterized protein isoform X1 n=1 Tax=Linepithema humile TaxID=83485 RepID=UPI00351F5B61